MSILSSKVLAEAMKSSQVSSFLRSFPRRDQHPFFSLRMEPVAGENCKRLFNRFSGDDELLILPRLPHELEMAVTASAFIAKVA